MSKRTQYISHELIIKFHFSPIEHAVINLINSRPNYYLENLSVLSKSIGRSIRTVQRAITKLLQKGMITRQYTFFKRLILRLAPLDEQKKIANGGAVAQAIRFCSFKRQKKADTTKMSCPDTTNVSQSTIISNEKKSILNTVIKTIPKFKQNLDQKRAQLIAQVKENAAKDGLIL